MQFRDWDDIPEFMQNEAVRKYYDILQKRRFSLVLKRFFDIVLSIFMIIIFIPVFVVISVWIKTDSEGHVFYRQERITQYGKIFRIFKFRTMVINADKIGTLVTAQNDIRITKVGRKIRKIRLDEIPQLFNILTGDMSFVGTRPEVKKYVDVYTDEMKATLLLPAGVTSMASIAYKDEDNVLKAAIDVDEVYRKEILPQKMDWNLDEIRKFSLFHEIKIMLKTVISVFS